MQAQFEVCKRDWISLRQAGHRGIAIECYIFDRCGFPSWERTINKLHLMKAHECDSLNPGLPQNVSRMMEWVVVVPCAAHDCHNSLKWAMWFRFDNRDLVRDAYVCIAALRNSFNLLIQYMNEWLATVIEFKEPSRPEEVEAERNVLVALGVDPEAVQLLSETLQLQWKNVRLLVSSTYADHPDVVGLVSAALIAVFRFVPFPRGALAVSGHIESGHGCGTALWLEGSGHIHQRLWR